MNPAIAVVICENKDRFHDGVFVEYLIAIDCTGQWWMWDDPSPDFLVRLVERNTEVEPSITRRTCHWCKKRGCK